ncbi:Hypothetical protein, putative [Bodo saltans]|uniref:Uncharacterized protein n=1 Tax=Bodo saltans TaxID=75058 RepID=A0A0S4IS96_BODSA|nr:Hypothetical protein, putative [Bodo saltans]|eukprot:CUF59683.1 Hypothetical protein, putative [Bodo saltans]
MSTRQPSTTSHVGSDAQRSSPPRKSNNNPFKAHIPTVAPNPKLVNLVPARYSTPTPQRETLVKDMAEKLRRRRELEESRAVALQALRVLSHVADRFTTSRGPHHDGETEKPGGVHDAAALLEQLRHEDERIIGAESPSSRSGSRSRSPPSLVTRKKSPSTGRHPSPSLTAYHAQGSSKASIPSHSKMFIPESPVRLAYHANDGKPPVSSPRVIPVRLTNSTVEANPLPLRFDPRHDHHTSTAANVGSQIAPFFSQYVAGVTGKYILPSTFAAPPPETNRRLQIVNSKRLEKERNERMKLEHPPRRKQWNYWDRLEARKLPSTPRQPPLHVDAAATGGM